MQRGSSIRRDVSVARLWLDAWLLVGPSLSVPDRLKPRRSSKEGTKVSGIHREPILFAARALRDFGDGFVAILLTGLSALLGFSPPQVGIIADRVPLLARRS